MEGGGAEGPPPPCIVYMDSMPGLHDAQEAARNLSSWLMHEWRVRKAEPSKRQCTDARQRGASVGDNGEVEGGDAMGALLAMELPLLKLKVPRQENGFDCGVFVLQYCEELIARMPTVTTGHIQRGTVPGFGPGMFTQQQMTVISFVLFSLSIVQIKTILLSRS